jgi:hypothetical protein
MKIEATQQENKDQELIMVVTNPERKIVLAGRPRKLTAQECRDYMAPGWKVETMTFKEYRESGLKWAIEDTATHNP